MSEEKINSIKTSYYSITPILSYYGTEARVEFNGSCLKQDEITFNHGKIVNIYIVYEISKKISISDYLALENCLFGAVSLTENADINKYKYSGYGVAFDGYESFSFPGIGLGKNVIMFGVDTSSFIHADNKKKYFWFLVKVLHKDKYIHWLQKKCIRLILQSTIKCFV